MLLMLLKTELDYATSMVGDSLTALLVQQEMKLDHVVGVAREGLTLVASAAVDRARSCYWFRGRQSLTMILV